MIFSVLSDVHIWMILLFYQMCNLAYVLQGANQDCQICMASKCAAEPASLLYFIGRVSHQLARALQILLSVLPGVCHHNAALNSGPYNELPKITRIRVSRHLVCENRCVCNSGYSCTYSFQTDSEIVLQVNCGQVQIAGKWGNRHFNYD